MVNSGLGRKRMCKSNEFQINRDQDRATAGLEAPELGGVPPLMDMYHLEVSHAHWVVWMGHHSWTILVIFEDGENVPPPLPACVFSSPSFKLDELMEMVVHGLSMDIHR